MVETLRRRHVVHHDDPVRAPVVRARNGPEALLPRGVPYLQLDGFAVDFYGAETEVDADCGDVGFGEGVVGEAEEEAGFTYA
eukprot:CAMPEP_0182499488 /NCGR_PEP_ID=MMETSP1321-20130603/7737_1 /TAXON_ID=91990 /ORGANISM="Bolidomonas sp., Strain RCC1657" /LENGTH=81 /DNA_ID=CAMNT_0024703695 /DNA_START=237 /DNA_END=482 /DNA_ORIENTATION=+